MKNFFKNLRTAWIGKWPSGPGGSTIPSLPDGVPPVHSPKCPSVCYIATFKYHREVSENEWVYDRGAMNCDHLTIKELFEKVNNKSQTTVTNIIITQAKV